MSDVINHTSRWYSVQLYQQHDNNMAISSTYHLQCQSPLGLLLGLRAQSKSGAQQQQSRDRSDHRVPGIVDALDVSKSYRPLLGVEQEAVIWIRWISSNLTWSTTVRRTFGADSAWRRLWKRSTKYYIHRLLVFGCLPPVRVLICTLMCTIFGELLFQIISWQSLDRRRSEYLV